MPQIVLFAGVLLVVYGAAALAGGSMASSERVRQPSRLTAALTGGVGAVLVVAGLSWLLAG